MMKMKLIGVTMDGQGGRSLSSGFAAVLALLAALLVSALALAPRAGAHIYWTNGTTGNIGRANLHGKDVNKHFISGAVTPVGLAVAGRHIYWADTNTETIGRASLNGRGVNQNFLRIHAPFSPQDVAVDAGHIYWPSGGMFVARAKINGKGAQPKFIKTTSIGFTSGVAVNTRHVYWTTNVEEKFHKGKIDTIGRARSDGTGVKSRFINSRHSGPSNIAVNGRYIYWTSEVTNTISRARLNGTGGVRRRFITTGKGSSPRGIAVGAGHI